VERTGKLRIIYAIALVDIALLAGWGVLFDVRGLLDTARFGASAASGPFGLIADAFLISGALITAAPLVFLLIRPMGWGKLLMPVYGLSWLFHVAIIQVLPGAAVHVVGLWAPVVCALTMFALTVACQIIEPGFFRNPP
jgi:hypothetical protein